MNQLVQAAKHMVKSRSGPIDPRPSTNVYPIFAVLAMRMAAYVNRMATDSNPEVKQHWLDVHSKRMHDLVSQHLPSGGGFDYGTSMQLTESTPEKLVFHTAFHHMDTHGCYDGWTEHTITVRPSLGHGVSITVSGRNRNDVRDYIAEIFNQALRINVTY
ncbi:hypothetical protein PJWF_00117 [Achromobacter phage JWF]|uniref:hypothetical protein n=1 Tax=Achromobacter phage JWF TaxID=1589748 RepID=UPI000588E847|nr:hypothetical protein AXJ13_gp071 [Achromobacter phage JWF]AJD83010.1 hypothetical protein PJWF_00117 [Achromobacter phage JWF]